MAFPASMMQISANGAGGPEVLKPIIGPVPQPKPDEVLIRVAAAGVNRPDVAQRAGSYPPPPGASPIIGLEVAGEVVAVGPEVTAFRLGDQVCALTNGGGYAQYCAAPEAQTLPWPRGYDAVRAAALPETYFTVWANMFMLGRLARGESALVHGGTSGIGVTAIQLAHEFGATVAAGWGRPRESITARRISRRRSRRSPVVGAWMWCWTWSVRRISSQICAASRWMGGWCRSPSSTAPRRITSICCRSCYGA